jgi:hypothetical protein
MARLQGAADAGVELVVQGVVGHVVMFDVAVAIDEFQAYSTQASLAINLNMTSDVWGVLQNVMTMV